MTKCEIKLKIRHYQEEDVSCENGDYIYLLTEIEVTEPCSFQNCHKILINNCFWDAEEYRMIREKKLTAEIESWLTHYVDIAKMCTEKPITCKVGCETEGVKDFYEKILLNNHFTKIKSQRFTNEGDYLITYILHQKLI